MSPARFGPLPGPFRAVERLTTFSCDLPLRPQVENPREFELVRATATDIEDMHVREPKGLTQRKHDVLLDRLDTEQEVWLIRDSSGAWVGWCHLVRGEGPNSRIRHTLRLSRDEVYLFDDGTLPQHRRRGAHSFAIARRMDIARDRGATRAVTTITNSNRASIASYARAGFRPRSQLVYIPQLRRSVELPLTPHWLRRLADGYRRRQRR